MSFASFSEMPVSGIAVFGESLRGCWIQRTRFSGVLLTTPADAVEPDVEALTLRGRIRVRVLGS